MNPRLALYFFLLVAALASSARATPAYETVADFQLAPSVLSSGSLLLHTDGNFYGTSLYGGAQDRGTIYKVTPAGVSGVVANFNGTGGAVRGRFPRCRLVSFGGLIWGSTTQGGTSDRGTIFKFNPATGELITLIDFIGNGSGAVGESPQGGLASDGLGNLWGVTFAGGSADRGTIFKINAATGVLTTVIEFTGISGVKGMNPFAGLVSDGTGNFWGTTQLGGAFNAGTVFKINIATGVLTTVVDFPSSGNTPRSPYSALAPDGAGSFWGTSYLGGASNLGTVYKVNATTGALTTVVQFTGTSGARLGSRPSAELASDGLGFFWGTCNQGGSPNSGTIFKVNISSSAFTSILAFNSASAPGAENPFAGLSSDGSGNFWGTTANSFSMPGGTVFKVNIGSGALTFQARFQNGLSSGLGDNLNNPLVQDSVGSLWGTTYSGPGAGPGTIFKVNPLTGAVTRVAVFNGTSDKQPAGGLVDDGAGFFWGVTSQGGSFFNGSVYKVNATTGTVTSMVAFTGASGLTKGTKPLAGLTKDGRGFLWGVTGEGGSSNDGTIFKMNIATGAFTTMVQFTDQTGPFFGYDPTGQLVNDATGNLWGTTRQGGSTSAGTIFKINAISGAFTSVITFTGVSGAFKGAGPWAGLTSDGAGNFWGTTVAGGSGDFGTVFKVNATTGALTTVAEFGGSRGIYPKSALVRDGAGNFWGMTNEGGASGLGTIFKVTTAGAFTSVFDLTGYGGAVPGQKPAFGGMCQHTDGHLYGTFPEGGIGGGGLVFRLRFGPTPVTLAATNVAFTGATLNGTLNPNGTVTAASFDYGTDPALATFQTIAAGNTTAGSSPESVVAAPAGLVPGRTYYFRVVGRNAENANPQRGEIVSFGTLSDTTPPTLNLPASITVTATSPAGAVVNYTASASDPGGSGVASSSFIPPSGSTFPIGLTTVNASASDIAGNTVAGSFTVTVSPNPPPTGGTFSVAPNNGVRQGDVLTLTAAGWSDPDLPLTYQFFLGTSALNSTGSATTLNVSAPAAGTYTLKVRVTDSSGSFTEATQPLSVVAFTPIESWRLANFNSYANIGDAADSADWDHDAILNLMEFAFGTDPKSNASGPGPLRYSGTFNSVGAIVATGQPITMLEPIANGVDFRALYVRRKDYVTAGLTYEVEFSPANLSPWTTSTAVPTVLADDGAYQIVSVPYPPFIGGKKARFFRVRVTVAP